MPRTMAGAYATMGDNAWIAPTLGFLQSAAGAYGSIAGGAGGKPAAAGAAGILGGDLKGPMG